MMKLLMILALGTLTAVASLAGPAVRLACAQDPPLSIASLRGKYAGKSTGFTTVCENTGGCSGSFPTLLQKNFVAVTEASFDEAGSFCGTATATNAPAEGSAIPTVVATRIVTGGLTSFNPGTAEGEVSFEIYNGGSCDGPKFDNSGATLTTTGTAHVVVSDGGNRIDGIVKTYIGTAGQFGSVLNKITLLKQERNEEHHDSEGWPRHEHELGPSLRDMRGNYVGKSVGFETVCINAGGCSAPSPVIVPLNFEADIEGTLDGAGNYCAIATSASSPVNGSAAGAFVSRKVGTGSVVSFDRKTGEADTIFSDYAGGSCKGATFDPTGATLLATGTAHVVISEGGNRIDSMVKSYVSAVGKIAGVVNTTTFYRQEREKERRGHRDH